MPKISWNSEDFRNPQDSSGTSTEKISGGGLKQGYFHGSTTRGLVAYYPMDSGSGSTILDGALDNDGTINGASWTTDSKIGEACLSFDGTDDYVNHGVGYPSDQVFTISAWANTNVLNPSGGKFPVNLKGYGQPAIRQNNNGDGVFGLQWHDGSWQDLENSGYSTGEWVLVCGVWDKKAGEVRLHILSESQGLYTDTASFNGFGNSKFAEGDLGASYKRGSTQFFDGKVDDVRIYNRALSTPEIQALYNLERPSKISAEDTLV